MILYKVIKISNKNVHRPLEKKVIAFTSQRKKKRDKKSLTILALKLSGKSREKIISHKIYKDGIIYMDDALWCFDDHLDRIIFLEIKCCRNELYTITQHFLKMAKLTSTTILCNFHANLCSYIIRILLSSIRFASRDILVNIFRSCLR